MELTGSTACPPSPRKRGSSEARQLGSQGEETARSHPLGGLPSKNEAKQGSSIAKARKRHSSTPREVHPAGWRLEEKCPAKQRHTANNQHHIAPIPTKQSINHLYNPRRSEAATVPRPPAREAGHESPSRKNRWQSCALEPTGCRGAPRLSPEPDGTSFQFSPLPAVEPLRPALRVRTNFRFLS